MTDREVQVRRLWQQRPRSTFARVSALLAVLLTLAAWLSSGIDLSDITEPRRVQNIKRFLGEIQPYPNQKNGFHIDATMSWAARLLSEHGLEASRTTLGIAIAAIVLAGAGGLLFIMPSARTVATPEPFGLCGSQTRWRDRWAWRLIVTGTRAMLIFARAIPEYILAYLFVAMLGLGPWPAVLALALHNLGILGKLGSEVVENVPSTVPAAISGLGSTRSQVAIVSLFPYALPRFLLYFSYRWETCLRDATVLGLLGIATLGRLIMDARAHDRYDEMVFFMLMGAVLVLVGEVITALARGIVRRSS